MAASKAKPRVYSYLRFSTPEQEFGSSEKRQEQLAASWLARNKLTLYETQTDRGLSGYSGTHRKKGHLGRFLHDIEAGKVPRGSILLVENIDRLSREETDKVLKEICFKLWDNGITLQTIEPEDTFAPGNKDDIAWIKLLFGIQRGQAESKRKSDLIQASRNRAFDDARQTGKMVTSRAPAWLTTADNGTRFALIPEAAKTIERIFEMKRDGLGNGEIERQMNKTATWSPPPVRRADQAAGKQGNGWRSSYIKKILNNRAVIGEYQPHVKRDGPRKPVGEPIKGYYPAVVSEELFFAVKKKLDTNRGKGGRTGRFSNVLRHLVVCGYCGRAMHYTDKGKRSKPGLVCDGARRQLGCPYHSVRYDEVLTCVLDNCHLLRPADVLPDNKAKSSESKALQQRISAGQAKLGESKQQLDNLVEQIARTPSQTMRDKYEERAVALETEQSVIETQIATDKAALDRLTATATTLKRWQADIATLRAAIAPDDATDVRAKLNAHLREFVDTITIYPVGFAAAYDKGLHGGMVPGEVTDGPRGPRRQHARRSTDWDEVDRIGELIDELDLKPRKQAKGFAQYVLGRRMSREGRFCRVRFRTGERQDLVPPGSLATGKAVLRGEDGKGMSVERTLPDLNGLWEEFKAGSN
ncbi:hypothetical protein FF011L_06140 [Roseimaritima multifibrata]|uniref:Recombinase domain-containing protein n=1 Tax=Roseimaritima multifibrata TaxID=1930274 RepID=A0A517MAH9_9BACT|nr:recombinase family protein [Roseimaritima multifibrata]QDS91878.1 hypothetical protein FF011L_06140 [Roseimaritima multifibrata]